MLNIVTETKRQLVCLCEWIQTDAREHMLDGTTDEYINRAKIADAICVKLFANEPLTEMDREFLKGFYGTYGFITTGRWEKYLLIDYLDSLDSIGIWTSLDECIQEDISDISHQLGADAISERMYGEFSD